MPEQPPSKLYVPAPVADLPPAATPPVRYVELHCKTNFSFLEGASHPDELVDRGGQAGLCRAGRHRSEQPGGRGPRPRRRQGGRPQADHRGRDHAGRCQPRLALGDEPRWLWPALPALDPRPSSGSEGRMPPRLRGCRRARRAACSSASCCRRPATCRRTCRDGAKSFPIEPTPWPSCIAASCDGRRLDQWQRAAQAARVPLDRRGRCSLPRRQPALSSGCADGHSAQDDRRRAGHGPLSQRRTTAAAARRDRLALRRSVRLPSRARPKWPTAARSRSTNCDMNIPRNYARPARRLSPTSHG